VATCKKPLLHTLRTLPGNPIAQRVHSGIVLGADELLGLRLNQDKSALEKFFFSLQWTRESLRGFPLPLVLWLTPWIAAALANQAPDFWSWRGGVFEFSQPMAWAFAPERRQSQTLEQHQGW
jgi:hypothetical protein